MPHDFVDLLYASRHSSSEISSENFSVSCHFKPLFTACENFMPQNERFFSANQQSVNWSFCQLWLQNERWSATFFVSELRWMFQVSWKFASGFTVISSSKKMGEIRERLSVTSCLNAYAKRNPARMKIKAVLTFDWREDLRLRLILERDHWTCAYVWLTFLLHQQIFIKARVYVSEESVNRKCYAKLC